MKKATNLPSAATATSADERGSVRTLILVAIFFCLGLVLSAAWFHRPAPPAPTGELGIVLSQSSRALLDHLDSPVEIRFYSLIDPNAPATLKDFSARVDQLLKAYQQAAPAKILLDNQTNANPNAALADGIKGFNLDKGEGCYLGLSLSCAGKKESLAQLSPEWEAALEADVSRAIEAVAEKGSPGKITATPAPEDTAMKEEIQRAIPNLASVSTEDALRVLQEDSINQFKAAVTKMNELVQEAQADLLKAQKQGSAAEQDAALKRLQAVQTEQTQTLKQIAAASQARIDLLKKLKAAAK